MRAVQSISAVVTILALAACTQPKADPVKADPVTEQAAPVVEAKTAPAPAAASASATASALTRVENAGHVCMVNDQFMGVDQIPVVVSDKTYFGCCAMCKEKLEKNETARTGKDPVTGKPVDKAVAVIGRDESGKVFYFESEDTMRQFKL